MLFKHKNALTVFLRSLNKFMQLQSTLNLIQTLQSLNLVKRSLNKIIF